METLSDSVWTMYFVFLVIALATSIIYWIYQRFSIFAVITIVLSLLTPLVAFIFYVQRPRGINEYAYLKEQLQAGDNWAIFLTIGYIYLMAWLVLLLVDLLIYLYKSPYINQKLNVLWGKCVRLMKPLIGKVSQLTKNVREKCSQLMKDINRKVKGKFPSKQPQEENVAEKAKVENE